MGLQQLIQLGFCWGVYAVFLVASMQPGISVADEEGERERLNLYDRNRRNQRWEREKKDYNSSYKSSRSRARDYYHDDYDSSYRPSRRRTIQAPSMAPPE